MKKQTQYQKFFSNLQNILSRVSNYEIKEVIGDSTNNNRVATVPQVIRFLEQQGNFKLAEQLDFTYTVIYDQLWADRTSRNVIRQDSFDISEFNNTYENYVLNRNTPIRKQVIKVVA